MAEQQQRARRDEQVAECAPVVLDWVSRKRLTTIGRTDALLPRQGDRQQGAR